MPFGSRVSKVGDDFITINGETYIYNNKPVKILNARKVDFEFDGEMTPEVALDYDLIKENYPFCRLSGPANVLIMPSLLAANISFKLLCTSSGEIFTE